MTKMYNLKQVAKSLNLVKVRFYPHKLTAKCINPLHNDEHPSMVIFDSGYIMCSACGFNSHIKSINDKIEVIDNCIPFKFEPFENELKEIYIPDLPLIDYPYKNIPIEILQKYEIRDTGDGILVPIKMFNKYVGYYYVDGQKKKYSMEKTIWGEHFSKLIYPLEQNIPGDYIIFVEGIFDALALIAHGFRSACVFGTNFSNETIIKKIRYAIACGTKRFFVWFDGDIAGKNAALKFKEMAKNFVEVNIIDFNIEADPDELIADFKNQVKKIIKGDRYENKKLRKVQIA